MTVIGNVKLTAVAHMIISEIINTDSQFFRFAYSIV